MRKDRATRTTKNRKPKSIQWRELGEVAVDSGQIVVCDPAYLTDIDAQKFYDQVVDGGEHVEDSDGGGILNGAQIPNTWGKRYLGLKLPNFGGDGVFPVIGAYTQDGLAAVIIDLSENRWESFQGERITKEELDALVAGCKEEKPAQTHTLPAAA